MGLYNKSFGKLDVNLDELERINEDIVTNAFIYRYRDIILKKYWYCTEYAISDDVFDRLCNIDNDNFIKLYELFTIIPDNEYEKMYARYQSGRKFFCKDGYTAKYYQPDPINPILEPSTYLIKSIEELKALVDTLSNSKIMMTDTKVENTIIQNNGIIIIDPDYYKISNQSIEVIKKHNYKELLQLLKTIFAHYVGMKKTDILKLFNEGENSNSLETICDIEKRLRKVKRPIDLVTIYNNKR